MQKKAVSPASKSKLPDRSDLALELLLKTYTSKKLNKKSVHRPTTMDITQFLSTPTSNKNIKLQIKSNRDKQEKQNSKYRDARRSKAKKIKNTTINFDNVEAMYEGKVLLEERYMNAVAGVYANIKDERAVVEEAKYFLGSVFRKINGKKGPISYLQFLDQCIKVFKVSTYHDINSFLQVLQNSRKNPDKEQQIRQNTNALKQRNLNIESFRVSWAKQDISSIKSERIQKQQSAINKQNKECDKNRKQAVLVMQNKNEGSQEQYGQQLVKVEKNENMRVTPFRHNKLTEEQKQNQNRLRIQIDEPEAKQQIDFRNLPITASLQSQKTQCTPYLSRTQKSLINSPIQKVQTISKAIQNCLINPLPSNRRSDVQCQVSQTTDRILSELQTKMQKISQNLHMAKADYPSISMPTFSQNQQSANFSSHLHEKYGDSYRNVRPFESIKFREIKTPKGSEQAGRFYSVGKNDDRIDMLAAKIQNCIQRNSERIQTNVRNLEYQIKNI